MNKSITVNHKGTDYTLEYTKAVVRQMEKAGFILEEVGTKPVTLIPILFAGAFKSKHEKVSSRIIEEIYDDIEDRAELIATLIEMYDDTVNCFVEDSEDNSKNSTWKKSW